MQEEALDGITGYLTRMDSKHPPFIQTSTIDQNRVIQKDNECNSIFEVILK
jgi:hypothetical protein